MNKLFTKIAALSVGLAMAIGVGVAVGSRAKEATPVHATPGTSPMKSTFNSKSWGVSSGDTWSSDKDAYQYSSPNVQVTAAYSGAGCTSNETYSNITKISVNALTTSKGVGNITIKVGNGSAQTICSLSKNTTATDYNLTYSTPVSGKVTMVVNCSTNSVYVRSITITYNATTPLTGITLSGTEVGGTSPNYTLSDLAKSDTTTGYTVTVGLTPTTATDQKVKVEHYDGDSVVNISPSSPITCSSGSGTFTVKSKGTATGTERLKISGNTETSVFRYLTVKVYDDSKEYHDVHFDSAGGSVSPEDESIEDGTTFTFPSAGTKLHYTFAGWKSPSDANLYAVGQTSPAVTDEITYTAQWTPVAKYNVTYEAQSGGTGSHVESNQWSDSYPLMAFADLSGVDADEGYRFVNYTVDGVDKDPGDNISLSGDTTVEVNFEEIPDEHEATFDFSKLDFSDWTNSYSGQSHTIEYEPGDVEFNDCAKQASGQTIDDIPVSKGGTIEFIAGDGITISEATFTLRQWGTKTKTVELWYSTDGGTSYTTTGITSTTFSVSDSDLPSDTNAIKITFSESANQVGIESLSIVYVGGSTPTPTTYSVTYDPNGATSGTAPTDENEYSSGDSVTVLGNTGNLAKTGYTFECWNTANDGSGTDRLPNSTFDISDDTVLYAKWHDNSDTTLLSFERNGTTNTYTSGYTFVAAAEAKSDYYQDGSGEERSLKLYRSSAPIISTAPTAISITAKLGGGSAQSLANPVYACYVDSSGEVIANTSVEITSEITAAAGSDFTAYLSAAGATSAYGVKIYHVKETGYNVRYYNFSVSYSNETVYTITYDANGGSGTMSPTIGTSPAVANCSYTYEGYTFERWNTQADGEGTDYAISTVVSSNIKLYAIWQEEIVPVGGNVTMTGVTSASAATVNGHSAIKCGASGTAGAMKLTLEQANITKIKVYIAGWKDDTHNTILVTINNSATISGEGLSDGKLTISQDAGINSGTPFTLDGEETDYRYEFTISANAPADTEITFTAEYASKCRFVVWGATDMFAETFATEFMSGITCDSSGSSAPVFGPSYSWSYFEGLFAGLDAEEQGRLHDATYTKSGSGSSTVITPDTVIANAVAKYDYIVGKYNPTLSSTSPYKDFIDRKPSPIGRATTIINILGGDTNSAATTTAIVVVSIVSAAAVGGYFFIRRRKVQ